MILEDSIMRAVDKITKPVTRINLKSTLAEYEV